MNIMNKPGEVELSERYDSEEDIYYVTFKTGEPSCVIEHDDILLLEKGIFTGLPTGFRILNFSKHKDKVRAFQACFTALIKSARKKMKAEFEAKIDARENQIGEFLEKVTA